MQAGWNYVYESTYINEANGASAHVHVKKGFKALHARLALHYYLCLNIAYIQLRHATPVEIDQRHGTSEKHSAIAFVTTQLYSSGYVGTNTKNIINLTECLQNTLKQKLLI